MICLLLIMTMIFINSIESAEQKVKHSDTILKEEDINSKTKAWLLMVESGKVDQEEHRRITPKSIFIAPLLSSRVGKCKEGYRHDHLGQCVKVIKIDPKVQLELLLQRLNKLYSQKKEKNEKEEEEDTEEIIEMSSGPLHFSLPISNADEKIDQTTSDVKAEFQVLNMTINATKSEVQSNAEFIPVPVVYLNQTNQTKEIESSGAEPLNESESYITTQYDEGSGDVQAASGDGLQEEESTTPPGVSFLSEEADYFDESVTESTTITEIYSVTESPSENFSRTTATVMQDSLKESYQNITDTTNVNISKSNNSSNIDSNCNDNNSSNTNSTVFPEVNVQVVKNISKSEKIHFPSDDDSDGLRTAAKSSVYSNRILFPDEIPQQQIPSYHSLPELNFKPDKYRIHHSENPPKEFWWLPENWQIDENQPKSDVAKVWSRLPLIHDITYSREVADDFNKSPFLEKPLPLLFNSKQTDGFSTGQQQPPRVLKPFKSSRFQDILLTPRQNFRFQR